MKIEVNLTPKQKQLLSIAKEKGYVTITIAQYLYSCRRNAGNAIRRLEMAGHLKQTEGQLWIYNGDPVGEKAQTKLLEAFNG